MKKFWPFSFYFFYFAAIATMLPYLVLYYGELGLSGKQIGVLTALPPLITLISAPLLTGYADSSHRHRLVLSLSLLSSIYFILAVSAVATFWELLPMIVMFAFSIAPAGSLADSATMSMLEGEREKYGRVRLGGTIGFGIASLFAGMIIQQSGLHSSFYMFAILMFIAMLFGLKFHFSKVDIRISISKGIRTLLADPHWVLFLSMVFVGGIGLTVVNTYLFFYMDSLGASRTLMGYSMVIATMAEIPVLFFSNRLITRLKAHGLLVLALAITGLRLILFSVVNAPVGIIVIQCLQGFTFPAVWVAGVSYANEHAPAGMSATAQGLFGSMLMGIGAATGNFIGGMLLDAYGPRTMYFLVGSFVILALLLLMFIERRLPDKVVEAAV